MFTSFGIWLLLGTLAFSLLLTAPVFYDDLKWDFKKNVGPWLGLTTFLFFGLLFITNFLGGTDVAVTKTEWRTIHPNEKKVTVAVKGNYSNYVTVTSKTKQRNVEGTNKIKLTQGELFIKSLRAIKRLMICSSKLRSFDLSFFVAKDDNF